MKMTTQVVFAVCTAIAFPTPVLLGQEAAVHEAPRYAQAVDLRYGEAISGARALIHAQMDALPGLSVAVGVDGRIVWAEGFGWADIEQRVPVRPSSMFRVGSVAKPMTAALLALLYESGKLDLDGPVGHYVPGLPDETHRVTTRQLAGHLAGVRHYQGDEFLAVHHYETVLDGLEIFRNDALLSEPGTQYLYSSYGFNLLSAALEGAGDGDFLSQMEEHVFEPLGMRSTCADQNGFIVFDRVRPYVVDDEGRFANAPYVDNSYKWAGGGFLSTAEDLVRFGLAHAETGFLQAATLQMLHTSQTTRDGEETGYGVGWRVATDGQGRRRVGHGGGSVGGSTWLAVYPDQGLAIAMIANVSDGPDFPAGQIVELFLD